MPAIADMNLSVSREIQMINGDAGGFPNRIAAIFLPSIEVFFLRILAFLYERRIFVNEFFISMNLYMLSSGRRNRFMAFLQGQF